MDMIRQFYNVFATEHKGKGRTDGVRHKIDTGNARPIRQY